MRRVVRGVGLGGLAVALGLLSVGHSLDVPPQHVPEVDGSCGGTPPTQAIHCSLWPALRARFGLGLLAALGAPDWTLVAGWSQSQHHVQALAGRGREAGASLATWFVRVSQCPQPLTEEYKAQRRSPYTLQCHVPTLA
jgi:hypothetical protein